MGIERVLMLMEAENVQIPDERPTDLYIATMGEKAYDMAFKMAYDLRLKGYKAEIDHMGRGVKAQFKYADKIKAKYVVVIGDNEIESGVVSLKNMQDGTQTTVKADEIEKYLA